MRTIGRVAIGAVVLAVILDALAPHQGHALTVPSVTTPSVSTPVVSLPSVTVPTVTVPAPAVPLPTPTVIVPTVSLPKPSLPIPAPTVRKPSVPQSSVPSVPSQSVTGRVPLAGRSLNPQDSANAGVRSAEGKPEASPEGPNGYRASLTTASPRPTARDATRRGSTSRGRSGPLLSQQRLRKLVAQHKGCLSSLASRQSKVLMLRTGIGVKHAYGREQVAKILGVTLQQEGRLEREAVTGLTVASTNGRCGNPLGPVGSAMHLVARAALSFFAGRSPTGENSPAARPSVVRRAPVPPRSRTEAATNRPAGAGAPRVRSAGIATPQEGGFDWLLLAALLAIAATAVWFIFSRRRQRPAIESDNAAPASLASLHRLRQRAGGPTDARARPLGKGAGAGGLALVALRGAVGKNRRRARRPGGATPPAADPRVESAAGAVAAFELGGQLARNNDMAGAEAAYRRADEGGHPTGASNLGVLLEQRGDLAAAEVAYRRADQRGDAAGAFNLGAMLAERRDYAGAEAAYRRADQRGDAGGAASLGMLLERRGDLPGAEAAYRRADQRGDALGAFKLGGLLAERSELAGAEAAYRNADKRDHPSAASNLGVLLEERGDLRGAEAAYSRADARGDAAGAFNLAGLLEKRRDYSGAEAAYGRADLRGDPGAALRLGALLERRHDLPGAEAAYRRASKREQTDVAEVARAALSHLHTHE